MAELSPAAQVVLDAADIVFEQAGTTRQGIAAALRALADQVVPLSTNLRQNKIRDEILAIVAELEGSRA